MCDLITRREQTHSALVSCADSRFRETNHEFVQSNECEPIFRVKEATMLYHYIVSCALLAFGLLTIGTIASAVLGYVARRMWRNKNT